MTAPGLRFGRIWRPRPLKKLTNRLTESGKLGTAWMLVVNGTSRERAPPQQSNPKVPCCFHLHIPSVLNVYHYPSPLRRPSSDQSPINRGTIPRQIEFSVSNTCDYLQRLGTYQEGSFLPVSQRKKRHCAPLSKNPTHSAMGIA